MIVVDMGNIVRAKCSNCGFDSGHLCLEGSGLYDYATTDFEPAFCSYCKKLLVLDFLKKAAKCPKCKREVVFYNDSSLKKTKRKSKLEKRETKEDSTEMFKLYSSFFLCPECGKMTLKFIWVGLWD
jgi:DNA-directed RNA polymerase subunit M/transcription elongation factor TFIIS